jgi:hypothetical protein
VRHQRINLGVADSPSRVGTPIDDDGSDQTCERKFSAPNGEKGDSPGQRPGKIHPKNNRSPEEAKLIRYAVMPFQGLSF